MMLGGNAAKLGDRESKTKPARSKEKKRVETTCQYLIGGKKRVVHLTSQNRTGATGAGGKRGKGVANDFRHI